LAGDTQSSLELADQLIAEITSEYEAISRNESEVVANTPTRKAASRKNVRKSIFSPSLANNNEGEVADLSLPSPAGKLAGLPKGGDLGRSAFANKRALTSLLVSTAKSVQKPLHCRFCCANIFY
jgi:hypothetical protein